MVDRGLLWMTERLLWLAEDYYGWRRGAICTCTEPIEIASDLAIVFTLYILTHSWWNHRLHTSSHPNPS